MTKCYRFRLYPNKQQQEQLEKALGASRWVYNWALEKRIKAYESEKKQIKRFDLQAELPILKRTTHPWLNEVGAIILQASLANLDKAYKTFFRKKKGFPNFKSRKKGKHSFQVLQGIKFSKDMRHVTVPKIKGIKVVSHRQVEGTIKSGAVTKTPSGKYYLTFNSSVTDVVIEQMPVTKTGSVGIDLGLKSFLVLSNGTSVANPRNLIRLQHRIVRLQRSASKCVKGSKNKEKLNVRIAMLHEKVANRRKDFLHKVSACLVQSSYTTFCLEDLNVAGMVKNHNLAKAISDASWSEFVKMVEYKAARVGKNIIKIGTFEPSSKSCNQCGSIKKDLTLADRMYVCDHCGHSEDRDIQAAKNIVKFAFKKVGQEMSDLKPVEYSSIEDTAKQEVTQ